ncbi:5123_t:CDS:2 [Funneliformis caledonium]|uniref:5123_t:CDS:1 n=1 Tax=Funneliformis caledonium TaxID=1117310 RepID=A0A9N8YTU3_9GLOM|nr:5123_t:CDS:2 [Funneliformis caledonium]
MEQSEDKQWNRMNFEEDVYTLHSCLLVNRLWSDTAVSLLWSQPFRLTRRTPSSKLIQTYINCLDSQTLNDDEKEILEITDKRIPPTFNYPLFLRQLSYLDLYIGVSAWLEWYEPQEENYREQVANVSKILINSFMNCSRTFHKLSIETGEMLMVPNHHLNVFSHFGSEICLSKLRQFICIGDFVKTDIFAGAARVCKNIKTMFVSPGRVSALGERHVPEKQYDSLINLIKGQKAIEHFVAHTCSRPRRIVSALLESQINSLVHVEFVMVNFTECTTLIPLAESKKLETLTFEDCFGLEKVLEPFVSSTLTHLRKLNFKKSTVNDDVLATLIKNAGTTLSTIYLGPIEIKDPCNAHIIIDLVARHCPNLVDFAAEIQRADLPDLLTLLSHSRNLEKLEIFGNVLHVDSLLGNFFYLFPPTLEHLIINADWQFSSHELGIGLKNCKAKLKSLHIPDCFSVSDSHLRVITKYLGDSLQHLNVSYASPSQVTDEGLRKARSIISRVDYVYKEDRKYPTYWNLRYWGEEWVEEPIMDRTIEQWDWENGEEGWYGAGWRK